MYLLTPLGNALWIWSYNYSNQILEYEHKIPEDAKYPYAAPETSKEH